MVAPIGNIVNKSIFSPTNFNTTITALNVKSSIPTMSSVNDIGMDIPTGQVLVSELKVRGKNPVSYINLSRESLMASSGCLTSYHNRMDINIDFNPTIEELNLELSYETEQEKALQVSMAANYQETTRPLNVHNEVPLTHASYEEEIINIQLPYDTQAPTKLELWSGSFHPISLHRSIEHFASDSKNIKVSLNFLAKYIKNKQVNSDKVNKLVNFDGMGDAIWNFISSVYETKWNALYTDQKSNTLRTKISSKFTLRLNSPNNSNKKEIAKPVPVTINKVPPLPSLLAKTKKEVNAISKYFHPKKSMVENNVQGNNTNSGKSYAQASKTLINTSEVLKIKETFLSLNTHKINQVNNIINGQNKPKPCIKITTKGPSRKQVIISMSSENVISFMKSSSLHIANINRLLCNAKSDMLVDYIHSDNTGITVITSKVAQHSNMSIINQYIKNSNDINFLQVEEPRLPKSKSYLKIIGIPFFPYANSQEKLTSNDIKTILKQNHIFNNISLASKPRVIKVLSKSDMSIVWLDIWDIQSSNNAKMLINRCFNVRNYIATIWGANMNPSVPQCKNC